MLPPSQSTLKDQGRTNRDQSPQGCRAGSSGREWLSVGCYTKRSPSPVTRDINQEITSLYPVDPNPAIPSTAQVSHVFTAEVMEFIPNHPQTHATTQRTWTLGHARRVLARFWHPGRRHLFSRIIAHISTATLPDAVLQNLRAGQGTPLEKPSGGHRPLLMMSFYRRLALKAIIAAKKKNVGHGRSWPTPTLVDCQDGANKMIKSIQYCVEADQSRVLVALDLKVAFQNVSRRQMLHCLGQHGPDLATVFSRWYTGSTTHRMHYDGSYAHIQASSGIDQGCPLSPCGFAAAVDPTPRFILSATQRTLNSGAKLWAYFDDWYI